MGAGVVLGDGAIPPLCHYLVPQHQHGAYRDLAYPLRPGGQGHGMAHPAFVLLALADLCCNFRWFHALILSSI
jgi:hypothetical protein